MMCSWCENDDLPSKVISLCMAHVPSNLRPLLVQSNLVICSKNKENEKSAPQLNLQHQNMPK